MQGFVHLISVVVGAVLFQPRALGEIAAAPGLAFACVPLLAGLSELAGQSFILVSRRVDARQALASFALTGLIHVAGVSVWTGAALLVLEMGQGVDVSPAIVFAIVAACYGPRLLGVLTIAPYYGELLGRALDAWTLVCVGWGLFVAAGAALPGALFCAGLGWIVTYGVRHFGGYLSGAILYRLRFTAVRPADV